MLFRWTRAYKTAHAHMISVTLGRQAALGSVWQAEGVKAGFFCVTPRYSSVKRRTYTSYNRRIRLGRSDGGPVHRTVITNRTTPQFTTAEPQIRRVGSYLWVRWARLGQSISTNTPPTTNKVYQSLALFSSARPRRREEPRTAAQNRSQVGKEGRGPVGKQR